MRWRSALTLEFLVLVEPSMNLEDPAEVPGAGGMVDESGSSWCW